MRFKMMKYYETIDVISKKIAALNTNDADNPPPRSALRLQTSIRQAAHAYLQVGNLLHMAFAKYDGPNCESSRRAILLENIDFSYSELKPSFCFL